MKKWTLWLALVLFTSLGSWVKGQPAFSIVGFTATPDSLIINEATGDTLIHYEILLANVGDMAYFSTSLDLTAFYVSTGTTENWWSKPTPLTIPAHDTLEIDFDDVVLPSTKKYVGGGDIIVIWPSNADGAMILDSGSTTVYIDGIIAVDPVLTADDRVTPFPNPSRGELYLEWGEHENLLESVSIIDAAGREWRLAEHAVKSFNLHGMPPGIYYLRVQYSDGLKAVYKIHLSE